MPLIIVVILLAVGLFLSLKKLKCKKVFSKSILFLLLFSLFSTLELGLNYLHSLIPEANDGIGMINILSRWMIGDDNWSIELYRNFYQTLGTITLVLLFTFIVALIIENSIKKNNEK